MRHKLAWAMARIRQTLWFRPLLFTALAIGAVIAAGFADRFGLAESLPEVDPETLEDLLTIIATSMLSVATFAVASMVAAYASAGSNATPRAFALVITDDVSRTALSGFIGAFIFSIVSLTAVKTGTLGQAGLFVVFALTTIIFGVVIMLFLRWVDRIARLGRLGSTIQRAEDAAARAIRERRRDCRLGGAEVDGDWRNPTPIETDEIGYVQSIDLGAIQRAAERASLRVAIQALPGTFVGPGRALASTDVTPQDDSDLGQAVRGAFIIGRERTFETDPRFGLIVLSEIASRALSPAVNDPGTAIDIVGRFVRLFAAWAEPCDEAEVRYDRVQVPILVTADLFDDAFTGIARDGACVVEAQLRLQKAFLSLANTSAEDVRAAAVEHSRLALARAEAALSLPEEKEKVRAVAAAVQVAGTDPIRPSRTD